MTDFFICLIISILFAFGLAVALVEKGDTFTVRYIRKFLVVFAYKHISRKFARVFQCTICTSFWTTLFSDLVVYGVFHNYYLFFWPVSGFITLGFTWAIYEFFNIMDKDNQEVAI